MGNKKKHVILIVEDDPTSISGLVGILSDSYELIVAKDPKDAERLLSRPIDLVLLDLYLGHANGIDVLKTMKNKEATANIPVICFTVSQDNHDVEESFAAGAIDYVTKPYNQAILRSKIATFLDLKSKTEQLENENRKDPLTLIGNRRMFHEALDNEWRRMKRKQQPLGLAMIDLDNFKGINDHYGHGFGDACLKVLAEVMTQSFARSGDVVARLGGDEFAAILPEMDLESVCRSAEHFRKLVESEADAKLPERNEHSTIRVSIGCASIIPEGDHSATELIKQADDQLYEAKKLGQKNCVRPSLGGLSLIAGK